MHVVRDGLNASIDFDFKSEVFLFEGDDGVLKHGYLVAEVDFFVVKFFDGDAAIDRCLDTLYLLLEVLVVRVGGEGVFFPGGVSLEIIDFIVHFAYEFSDGFIGDWVKFLTDIFGINFAHHLIDKVLGLLHFFLSVVDLPSLLLLFLFGDIMDIFELLVELLPLLLTRNHPYIALQFLLLLLDYLPGLRGKDAQRFLLMRSGLLGTRLIVDNFLSFFVDGQEGRHMLLILEVHDCFIIFIIKIGGRNKISICQDEQSDGYHEERTELIQETFLQVY